MRSFACLQDYLLTLTCHLAPSPLSLSFPCVGIPEKLSQRIWKRYGHEFDQDLSFVSLYLRRNDSLEFDFFRSWIWKDPWPKKKNTEIGISRQAGNIRIWTATFVPDSDLPPWILLICLVSILFVPIVSILHIIHNSNFYYEQQVKRKLKRIHISGYRWMKD